MGNAHEYIIYIYYMLNVVLVSSSSSSSTKQTIITSILVTGKKEFFKDLTKQEIQNSHEWWNKI